MPLTPNDIQVTATFLDIYADYLTDDSCNDFELDDTPENRELVESAERYHYADRDMTLRVSDGKIHTSNFVIIRELRRRLLQ